MVCVWRCFGQTDTSRWDFVAGLEGARTAMWWRASTCGSRGVNSNDGDNNWAGLVVRNLNRTDLESGYLVAQRNNGEVFVFEAGATSVGLAIGYVPGQVNRLRVVARGNKITVYAGLGAAPVLTVTDTPSARAESGWRAVA